MKVIFFSMSKEPIVERVIRIKSSSQVKIPIPAKVIRKLKLKEGDWVKIAWKIEGNSLFIHLSPIELRERIQ